MAEKLKMNHAKHDDAKPSVIAEEVPTTGNNDAGLKLWQASLMSLTIVAALGLWVAWCNNLGLSFHPWISGAVTTALPIVCYYFAGVNAQAKTLPDGFLIWAEGFATGVVYSQQNGRRRCSKRIDFVQRRNRPPLMSIIAPLMKRAASLARNATASATSSA